MYTHIYPKHILGHIANIQKYAIKYIAKFHSDGKQWEKQYKKKTKAYTYSIRAKKNYVIIMYKRKFIGKIINVALYKSSCGYLVLIKITRYLQIVYMV